MNHPTHLHLMYPFDQRFRIRAACGRLTRPLAVVRILLSRPPGAWPGNSKCANCKMISDRLKRAGIT